MTTTTPAIEREITTNAAALLQTIAANAAAKTTEAQATTKKGNTMSSIVIFDIETGPLPDDILAARIEPFDESQFKHPGEFDPASVKYGLMKDEAKRAAKLEEKRREHAAAVESFAQRLEEARAAHFAEQSSKAALKPELGQVLAIGFWMEGRSPDIWNGGDEESLLVKFWKRFAMLRSKNLRLVGFNCCGFDLPFVLRRSWILGVPVPESALPAKGKWWGDEAVIDLAAKWQMGTADRIKLGTLAKALGVGEKNGNGADFYRLYASDPAAAIEYLRNDLELTARVASRLGVV